MTDTPRGMRGLLVPATTPFDPVTGEVAPVSLRDNLRRWSEAGVDGFVLFGSTGEGVLLEDAEKASAIEFARDVVGERLLVAGAGAEATRQVLRQADAMAAAGADAVIVQPPSYYGAYLSPEALRDHYLRIADRSPLPVIVYHIPKYTHVTMEAGLLEQLTRHENIAGIKDSSGDLKRLAEFTDTCGEQCAVFVGNGALFFAALEMGVAGGILAAALLAPAEFARILQWQGADRAARAGELQERMAPVHRGVVARHGVPGVKTALELLGYAGGPPRPPLAPLRERERREVATILREAGLLQGER